jgi:archaellin
VCALEIFIERARYVSVNSKGEGMKKATIALILVIAVMAFIVGSFSTLLSQTIFNTGKITPIGVTVYSDSDCTTLLSSIDWGTLNPSDIKTYPIYVKNAGTKPITLNMTTTAWNPSSATSYITVSWNQESHVLGSGQVVQAVLTLSVSATIKGITNFNFNLVITGTE